jgi:putative ATP-dependent endonuclease of OLD family
MKTNERAISATFYLKPIGAWTLKAVLLKLEHFRGIETAELQFDGHALLVGANNVGKSTLCEALDLVLGPDRLSRFPPVEEFDFYDGIYLRPPVEEGGNPTPIPFRVEVVLTELSPEVRKRCATHLEFWHSTEKRLLGETEGLAATPGTSVPCLRLETIGKYDAEEDEFTANTFYSHSPNATEGEKDEVRRDVKRLFGFLYLRALRTGSRALSLERGSLLDVLLRLQKIRTGLWEKSIAKLKGLDIENDAPELAAVLTSIEERLSQYVASGKTGRATKLHISQLTREHLRKTMAFFLAMRDDQEVVPFQQAGTGTLNTLVLALMSFIAELKPDSVIFAMEEPEIALPPHTQRRIADYLLLKTNQAFVTSHSPYIIERFTPEQTLLLTRTTPGRIEATCVATATGLKENDYKRYARRGLAECMLGRGVLMVEGVTEAHALHVLARCLERRDPNLTPLDIAGVSIFDTEGDGMIPKFGKCFRTLGLKTFAFYDQKTRKQEDRDAFAAVLDENLEHSCKNFELLISTEVPIARLRAFLEGLLAAGVDPKYGVVDPLPNAEPDIRKLALSVLSSTKGAGWAAQLFEQCEPQEFPKTVVDFLHKVYTYYPFPVTTAPVVTP